MPICSGIKFIEIAKAKINSLLYKHVALLNYFINYKALT